jgi:hypothetical protein
MIQPELAPPPCSAAPRPISVAIGRSADGFQNGDGIELVLGIHQIGPLLTRLVADATSSPGTREIER